MFQMYKQLRLTATNTVSAGPCRLLAIYFVAEQLLDQLSLKDGGSGGTTKLLMILL